MQIANADEWATCIAGLALVAMVQLNFVLFFLTMRLASQGKQK